jgi:DNA invertase Pin-like site-specific DNA recombinase
MNLAVIYARVSSREQEREGYSIPAQLKLLNEYAIKHNLKITKEFTDNETAKKEGRTNFTEMIKFLKQNKNINIILVEKTDRLYRNFKDYVLLDEFKDLEIHFVKEGTILSEKSRSHDKFMHGIKVLMAKNYVDNLSEEIKKGLQEQGEYPVKPPYGYQREGSKKIVLNMEKAPFVLRAYNLYADADKSLDKVSEQIYREGFVYSPTKPKISKSQLEDILKNVFYTGVFMFKGRLYKGNHEPLISLDLFNKVKEAFKKDNKPLYRNEHDFAFAGLLTCGECGSSITAEIKKGKYIYYHCAHGKGDCSQTKYIRQEAISEQFEEAVKKINLNNEQKGWLIEALKQSNVDEKEYHTKKIKQLNAECQKWRDRINQIYMDKLDGKITEEFWQEKHNNWTLELRGMQKIIEAYDKANEGYMEAGIHFLELSNRAYGLYSEQSSQEKAKLLKILLSNCKLLDGIAHWEYQKPFDILAKNDGCVVNWS